MSQIAAPEQTSPILVDPWAPSSPIPLNGVLERNRFAPLLTAFLALIVGLILFQGIAAVATIVLLLQSGVDLNTMMDDLPGLLASQAQVFIVSNTIGQVLGLALVAWGLARMHTTRPAAFLRLRKPDVPLLILSVLGLVALVPVVQWAGILNEHLPLPDVVREWDQTQMELVEQILLGDFTILFSLAMLALTPAICEELLFRGYVQRQAERGLGVAGGILLSGIIFGLYHLRLTQAIPLSLLGIYLAYLAWRTGSLWIPVIIHFLNNGLAVFAAAYIENRPDLDISALEEMEIPWYIALIGLAFFLVIERVMHGRAEALTAHAEPELVSDNPVVTP
ncbi:MAG TPA: type II CAAX endopeptidase family protein [Rhodothermales bacterium]|nr:type II CAAX endopeptidase family protein [Rhodothermales bacterium]